MCKYAVVFAYCEIFIFQKFNLFKICLKNNVCFCVTQGVIYEG